MTVEKWFSPKKHTGWHKTMPATKRRQVALKAHKNNALSAARSLQALANVTKDRETKKLAQVDAEYFFNLNRKEKK